ncbi:hypothetical protein Holit_00948 [Hollandina sp. SP2]
MRVKSHPRDGQTYERTGACGGVSFYVVKLFGNFSFPSNQPFANNHLKATKNRDFVKESPFLGKLVQEPIGVLEPVHCTECLLLDTMK